MDSRFLAATVGTVALGTFLAFLVGVLTRPTFFGFMLPMGLLFSDRPEDVAAKVQLIAHLGVATASGLAVSAALGLILVKTLKL